MQESTSPQLNKKGLKLYHFWRNIVYALFFVLFLFFSYKLIFPSKYFTYSFEHSNSLKNTITNISIDNNSLEFYTSTPREFSKIDLEIELVKKNSNLKNKKVILQKSYRAFFYPDGNLLTELKNVSENKLISSGISVFIVGHGKKYPINNPTTFESLGYNWDSVEKNTDINLSTYKKQKLFTISSTHPDGTIFLTDNNKYYYIENGKKKLLQNIPISELEKFKNPVRVDEKSLSIYDLCSLEKEFLSTKKYHCLIPINKISSFIGKDYHFKVNNIPNNLMLKQINISFKKSANKRNLLLFISDLRKRILTRFGFNSDQVATI